MNLDKALKLALKSLEQDRRKLAHYKQAEQLGAPWAVGPMRRYREYGKAIELLEQMRQVQQAPLFAGVLPALDQEE